MFQRLVGNASRELLPASQTEKNYSTKNWGTVTPAAPCGVGLVGRLQNKFLSDVIVIFVNAFSMLTFEMLLKTPLVRFELILI